MSSDAIRKGLLNWFLLLTTAVVLNSPHSSCAQEQGIQNFQKMKYGFFVHYVWGGTAYSATVNPDGSVPAGLDELADRFDAARFADDLDRKSTRLNSSHLVISYAVFCLK